MTDIDSIAVRLCDDDGRLRRFEWRLVAPLRERQIVELFDTGSTLLRDANGGAVLTLKLSPDLAAGDRQRWREIVLAVARHPGVVEASL